MLPTMTIQTTDLAHKAYTDIVSLRQNLNKGFWYMVMQLKTVKEQEYWKVLGYESFAAFLAQPEIDLALHTVENYISLYNKLMEVHGMALADHLDVGRVGIVSRLLTTENATDLLTKAQTLSRTDLKALVTGEEPLPKKTCVCPTCGNTHHV